MTWPLLKTILMKEAKERTTLVIDILPFEIKGCVLQEYYAIKEIDRSVDSYSTGK